MKAPPPKSSLNPPASAPNADVAKDRWLMFLVGTVVTHLMVIFLCPPWNFEDRDWVLVGSALFFFTLPFAWSIYLLVIYRGGPERAVSYLSVAASLIWLPYAYHLVFRAIRPFVVAGY